VFECVFVNKFNPCEYEHAALHIHIHAFLMHIHVSVRTYGKETMPHHEGKTMKTSNLHKPIGNTKEAKICICL